MSASFLTIARALSAGGQRALAVADVIPLLLQEGRVLGALVDVAVLGNDGVPVMADGEPVTRKWPPPEWFDRLARAIELGVLDHPTERTVRKVVDRILAPPLPAHVQNEAV